jgi:energy-coupling factor transporter ATP-binding protein EcfA2
VRIAFSGSHRVGKSTLVELLAGALPHYTTVDEPYYLLEEEGYECSETPSVEDFEAQLERSLATLEEGERNVLFDRCPADIFAYLFAHDDAGAFDADEWLDRTREAMQTLDLVVFVPIEERTGSRSRRTKTLSTGSPCTRSSSTSSSTMRSAPQPRS